MKPRKTIDNHFDRFDKTQKNMTNTVKTGLIGGAIGFVVGAVGGVYLGESLNEYITVLNQAPEAIQYAVDLVCGGVVGSAGAGLVSTIVSMPKMYKTFKDF